MIIAARRSSSLRNTDNHRSPMYDHSCSQLAPMMKIALVPIFLFLAVTSSVTSVADGKKWPSLPLPTSTLYEFPNNTWVENLAIRTNGDILVTLPSTPDIYLFNTSPKAKPKLVHHFSSELGLLGIAELDHDIFYIAAGNFSSRILKEAKGTYSVWEVDMRSFSSSGAKVRKVTDVPGAAFFNGLVALSKEDHTILVADSQLGVAWKVNVRTGAHSIAISDSAMAPNNSLPFPLGINGVKIRDGHLYFTNTDQGTICSVPISREGMAIGPVKVLATGLAPDDFGLDRRGRPWIAQNGRNIVSVLLKNGTVVNVAGALDEFTIAGPTSCIFEQSGRYFRPKGKGPILHCSTAGGMAVPLVGKGYEGGKVVVIETEGF